MAKRPPRFHGPNTWRIAREAYLEGEPARSVCARLDIGIHAFHRRMKVEGWSRTRLARANDLPPPVRRVASPETPVRTGAEAHGTAPPLVSAPPPRGPVDAAQLMQSALDAAARALAEGRPGDARTLSQMAESLSRTAARGPRTSLETILRALRDQAFRTQLFAIDPDDRNDPDLPTKRAYWNLPPKNPY